jgi:polyisoprenoid-binding protein YceI
MAVAQGTTFVITDASTIGFTGSKVTGSHEGGFKTFEGTITVGEGGPTVSSVEVTIDTTSLWADNERLTGHLRSPDFFGVETYPTAKFSSTAVSKQDEQYTITGNLELHGVTKSISFPASIRLEEGGVAVQAEFVIMRFDFGIEYPGKTDDLIRDEVVIQLDLRGVPATS